MCYYFENYFEKLFQIDNMAFKDRYDKILSDNRLSPHDVVAKTGINRATYYRMMSSTASKKYEEIEKLFSVCESDEQIIELATGKHSSKTDYNTEMLDTIKGLSVLVGSLIKEIRDLKEEIASLKCAEEVKKSQENSRRTNYPVKIPDH